MKREQRLNIRKENREEDRCERTWEREENPSETKTSSQGKLPPLGAWAPLLSTPALFSQGPFMPREAGPGTAGDCGFTGAPGALPVGPGWPGEIHLAYSWPSLAVSNHPAVLCRHLSLGKLEDGGIAPSGRNHLTWGLLFRGMACGSVPHPVTSICQFPVPRQITSPRVWGTALGLDRHWERSECPCASTNCPDTGIHKSCPPLNPQR